MAPSFYKPRRTKSVVSLQHSSNKATPWDDEEAGSNEESKSNSTVPILTFPDGVTVRPVRRSDATHIQRNLNDGLITRFYSDTTYPQPFGLWRAHKLIDEIFDQKSWRRPTPSRDTDKPSEDDVYEQAVQALADLNLERRLTKEQPWRRNNKNSTSSEKDKESSIPVVYAIAHNDEFIGIIELEFSDPDNVVDDDSEEGSGGVDPAFMHYADLCYWLAAEHRGRGIMTLVVPEFVAWGYRTFGHLERIEAAVFSNWNPPSLKVLQKTGFKREAQLVDAVRKNGEFGTIDIWTTFRPRKRLEVEAGAGQ